MGKKNDTLRRDTQHSTAVSETARACGVTADYVRKVVHGSRESDEILMTYYAFKDIMKEARKAVKAAKPLLPDERNPLVNISVVVEKEFLKD